MLEDRIAVTRSERVLWIELTWDSRCFIRLFTARSARYSSQKIESRYMRWMARLTRHQPEHPGY
jgi:hypothetical protein